MGCTVLHVMLIGLGQAFHWETSTLEYIPLGSLAAVFYTISCPTTTTQGQILDALRRGRAPAARKGFLFPPNRPSVPPSVGFFDVFQFFDGRGQTSCVAQTVHETGRAAGALSLTRSANGTLSSRRGRTRTADGQTDGPPPPPPPHGTFSLSRRRRRWVVGLVACSPL